MDNINFKKKIKVYIYILVKWGSFLPFFLNGCGEIASFKKIGVLLKNFRVLH
jgi:hypothetical protein